MGVTDSWEEVFSSCDGPKAIYFRNDKGKHGVFSNFAEVPVVYEGACYRCSEGAFQGQKTTDLVKRAEFINLGGGGAKHLGRQVELRSDWDAIRLQTMFNIVNAKFSNNAGAGALNDNAADILASTGDALILEDTTGWKDNIWGRDFTTAGIGKNWLGLCLMLCRVKLTGNPIVKLPYNAYFNISTVFQSLSEDSTIARNLGYLYNKIYEAGLYIR